MSFSKSFFHCYGNVLFRLQLLKLKFEGQTISTENLTKKLQNLNQNLISRESWVS